MKTMWDAPCQREIRDRVARLRRSEKARGEDVGAADGLSSRGAPEDGARRPAGRAQERADPLSAAEAAHHVCPPLPKGVPTAPELLARSPANGTPTCRLRRSSTASSNAARAAPWPIRLRPASRAAWGVLVYRHLDTS